MYKAKNHLPGHSWRVSCAPDCESTAVPGFGRWGKRDRELGTGRQDFPWSWTQLHWLRSHYCILLSPQISLEKRGSYCTFQQHWLTTKNLHCCGTKHAQSTSKHTDLSTTMWVIPQPVSACTGLWRTSIRYGLGTREPAPESQSAAVPPTMTDSPSSVYSASVSSSCARKYYKRAFLITEWYGLYELMLFYRNFVLTECRGEIRTSASPNARTGCADAVGTYGGKNKTLSASRPPFGSTRCLCSAS